MSDKLKLLEDKVEHLQDSLNWLCKRVDVSVPKTARRFSMGDRVYKTFVWPYYERGNIKEYSYGSDHGRCPEFGWNYLIEWDYNSQYPIEGKRQSWWSESELFGSLDEYKSFLKKTVDRIVREQYE